MATTERRLFYSLKSLDQWGDAHPTSGPIGARGLRVVNGSRPITKRSSTRTQPTARRRDVTAAALMVAEHLTI